MGEAPLYCELAPAASVLGRVPVLWAKYPPTFPVKGDVHTSPPPYPLNFQYITYYTLLTAASSFLVFNAPSIPPYRATSPMRTPPPLP
jgi:hypothetical protein